MADDTSKGSLSSTAEDFLKWGEKAKKSEYRRSKSGLSSELAAKGVYTAGDFWIRLNLGFQAFGTSQHDVITKPDFIKKRLRTSPNDRTDI